MGILRVAGMRLQPHAREIRPIVSEVQRAAASGEITVSEAGLLAPLEEDNLQLEKRAVAARHAGEKCTKKEIFCKPNRRAPRLVLNFRFVFANIQGRGSGERIICAL
jgi:hypothetical protein